jgi:hypothetical protein
MDLHLLHQLYIPELQENIWDSVAWWRTDTL